MFSTTKVEESIEAAVHAHGEQASDTGAAANADPVMGMAMERLRWLFDEARRRGLNGGDTASLATVDAAARPSVRTVTIAEIQSAGPVFFINTHSGKGQQLANNPQAALCFFWPGLRSQVNIEGTVVSLEAARADRMWAHRGRDQQLAAWIREVAPETAGESGMIGGRMPHVRTRFAWRRVSRPDSWHCLMLNPVSLRFWAGGWHNPRSLDVYRQSQDGNWWKDSSLPL